MLTLREAFVVATESGIDPKRLAFLHHLVAVGRVSDHNRAGLVVPQWAVGPCRSKPDIKELFDV